MTSVAFLKSRWKHVGGAEKYSHHLVNAFAAAGCDVTVLTTGPVDDDSSLPYDVVSLAPEGSWNLRQLTRYDRACRRWLKYNQVDIVFGMDRNTFQTHYRAGNGVHAAYLDRRRTVGTVREKLSLAMNPFHRKLLAYEKYAYESPGLQQIFTNSNMVREEITRYYHVEADKITVVHNGVEWTELRSVFNGWEGRRESLMNSRGLSPKRYQLLFIGNGYRRKGLEAAMRGMAALETDAIELSVVGKDRDVDMWRKFARKLKIADRVHFFGSQRPVYAYYQYADGLILPTLYDPFANVTVEALALGLRVITTRDNGGHEVIAEDCGETLESCKPDAVAAALERAIAAPKTAESAAIIRESVRYLDFKTQLAKIVESTLATVQV